MAVRLSDHTTLRLGGSARAFERLTSVDAFADRVGALDDAGEPVLFLGGGSNLVVADEGFAGTVIQIGMQEVEVERGADRVIVRAGAGVVWDELVARAVGEGWSGVEALSGIPGSVGATPMQNVGAYGQEVADVVSRVRVLDRKERAIVWMTAAECGFAYRHSMLRGKDDRVVVAVEMSLPIDPLGAPVRYAELARALGIGEGERAPLSRVRDTVISLRRGKGMVLDDADSESRSAGSFFTNPIVSADVAARVETTLPDQRMPRFPAEGGAVKLAAGWLIERAGFSKGQSFGRVHISRKHALALVTDPGATTAELLDAARAIRRGVHDRFGVTLEPEPIFVGCAI